MYRTKKVTLKKLINQMKKFDYYFSESFYIQLLKTISKKGLDLRSIDCFKKLAREIKLLGKKVHRDIKINHSLNILSHLFIGEDWNQVSSLLKSSSIKDIHIEYCFDRLKIEQSKYFYNRRQCHEWATSGQTEELRELIFQRAYFDSSLGDIIYLDLIESAIKNNHQDTVRFLIEQGRDKAKLSSIALFGLAESADYSFIKYLLNQGADVMIGRIHGFDVYKQNYTLKKLIQSRKSNEVIYILNKRKKDVEMNIDEVLEFASTWSGCKNVLCFLLKEFGKLDCHKKHFDQLPTDYKMKIIPSLL